MGCGSFFCTETDQEPGRAQGQVVEIRDPDLRLSGEEVASFLTQVEFHALMGLEYIAQTAE
jgi:hypothetical protein